jgi:hypothetical protein
MARGEAIGCPVDDNDRTEDSLLLMTWNDGGER